MKDFGFARHPVIRRINIVEPGACENGSVSELRPSEGKHPLARDEEPRCDLPKRRASGPALRGRIGRGIGREAFVDFASKGEHVGRCRAERYQTVKYLAMLKGGAIEPLIE